MTQDYDRCVWLPPPPLREDGDCCGFQKEAVRNEEVYQGRCFHRVAAEGGVKPAVAAAAVDELEIPDPVPGSLEGAVVADDFLEKSHWVVVPVVPFQSECEAAAVEVVSSRCCCWGDEVVAVLLLERPRSEASCCGRREEEAAAVLLRLLSPSCSHHCLCFVPCPRARHAPCCCVAVSLAYYASLEDLSSCDDCLAAASVAASHQPLFRSSSSWDLVGKDPAVDAPLPPCRDKTAGPEGHPCHRERRADRLRESCPRADRCVRGDSSRK